MHVFERNPRGVTFGWGVVFSDQTVENISANDPASAKIIADEFAHWDDIDVHIRGQRIRSSGHGFIGIGRKRLLEILQDRATELGVAAEFRGRVRPGRSALDRLRPRHRRRRHQFSRVRDRYADEFEVDVDSRANNFVWLGTSKAFDAFTFAFEQTEAGWVWAHAYKFAPDCSTFIVECSEETWRGLGFDRLEPGRSDRAVRANLRANISTATG